jgi:hypothetical protein
LIRGVVLAVQAGLLFLAASAALAVHWDVLDLRDPQWMRPACLLFLTLFVWSVLSWRLAAGTWIDPYSMFLSAAYLFHGGQTFLEFWGLNTKRMLLGMFDVPTTLDAMWYSMFGLVAMHMGGLWAMRRGPGIGARGVESSEEAARRGDLRFVGWLMTMVSLPATALVLKDLIPAVLAGGYQAIFQAEVGTGLGAVSIVLSAFLVPGALFLLAGSSDDRLGQWVSGGVLLLNGMCQLFLGARYHAVMPLVIFAWLWKETVRPLPTWLVLSVGAGIVMLFPLIAATRNATAEQRSAAMSQTYGEGKNPLFDTVHEMGGTLMVVGHTMQLVPATKGHDWGLTYFYGLLTLMPNFAWDLHPSIAYGSPTVWLVWAVDPYFAARGGSFGYSFLAEAYLSFGWGGAPWVLAAIGFGWAWLYRWSVRTGEARSARLAMLASFAAFFVFFAREETAIIARPLVWYSLLPYAAVFLVGRFRRSLRARHRHPTTSTMRYSESLG